MHNFRKYIWIARPLALIFLFLSIYLKDKSDSLTSAALYTAILLFIIPYAVIGWDKYNALRSGSDKSIPSSILWAVFTVIIAAFGISVISGLIVDAFDMFN